VLIVKQMASLSLDVPRLKVGLDLSSARTLAASVERMTRVATRHGPFRHAVWITPNDRISLAVWRAVVADQGGEMVAADLALRESYLKEQQEKDKTAYAVTGTATSDFQDTQENESLAERYPLAHTMLGLFPELVAILSHNEVEQRVADWDV
jgi:hypothetical protein